MTGQSAENKGRFSPQPQTGHAYHQGTSKKKGAERPLEPMDRNTMIDYVQT